MSGVDGLPEALAAIKKGELDATVFQDPEGQGGGGVWGCYLTVKGVKLPKDLLIPFTRRHQGQRRQLRCDRQSRLREVTRKPRAAPLSNACANPEIEEKHVSEQAAASDRRPAARVRRDGAPPPEELAYTTAATLARRIRRRELSPVEVSDHFIARIEALNPALNALVVFEFDEARERAKAAERKVMSGAALGPLHGVPLAMKDCFDFKPGWRNTFGGVRALKDYVAKSWSMFPERVEQAGAIILGKTNSPTFGFRGTCDNYLFGPTRNPFNLNEEFRWFVRRKRGRGRRGPAAVRRRRGRRRFDPHSRGVVRRLRLQAFLRSRAAAARAERLWRAQSFHF